jgi:hypothetical protein
MKQESLKSSQAIESNRRLAGAYAKYRNALNLINDLQVELAFRSSLERIQKIVLPYNFEIVQGKKHEVTAFSIASDWHVDEIVDSEALNGLNNFNLQVAEKRIETFFLGILRFLEIGRSVSTIDRLVFAALGDFISGWIHPALIESSLLTPPEALLKVYQLLLSGLKLLIEKGDLKELIFIGCCGNHGRITDKPRDKGMVKKSYEWILYEFLARSLVEHQSIIKFMLPKGYFNWLKIYDFNIRFHHGDALRYVDGVGGVSVPLRKAIMQWNKAKRADFDVLGHWHTRSSAEQYLMNGSLIGYNEFAEKHRCDYEKPSQYFFLLHPKYGRTGESRIVLD